MSIVIFPLKFFFKMCTQYLRIVRSLFVSVDRCNMYISIYVYLQNNWFNLKHSNWLFSNNLKAAFFISLVKYGDNLLKSVFLRKYLKKGVFEKLFVSFHKKIQKIKGAVCFALRRSIWRVGLQWRFEIWCFKLFNQ